MRNILITGGIFLSLIFFTDADLPITPEKQVAIDLEALVDDKNCDQNPTDDYVQNISGIIDGDEITLSVSARFAGAVDSITWRGKEFINIFDHGRQISYAWQMDGHGECLNPTEPGSATDLFNPSSTSNLLEVCKPAKNILTTKIHPAYWLGPGETGFCDGTTVTAVNDTLVSDQLFRKTIEIGYQGIENVIAFTAEIDILESYEFLQLEMPTGYLTYEFTNYWRFNPISGELEKPENQGAIEPWSFVHVSSLPPILSTEDNHYSMGVYTIEDVVAYEILRYEVNNLADATNKWNIVIHERPAPAGTYSYQSFIILGTLEQVKEGMTALYELHPKDLFPPEGYVDSATCDFVSGWVWDPKTPNQPISISVRKVNDDGSETTLYTGIADQYRGDLSTALGDNGVHGFRIPTSEILQSGEPHNLRVYGMNSNTNLPPSLLLSAENVLTCSNFSSPSTEDTNAGTIETTIKSSEQPDIGEVETNIDPGNETQNEKGSQTSINPFCFGGALPFLAGLIFWLDKKRKK